MNYDTFSYLDLGQDGIVPLGDVDVTSAHRGARGLPPVSGSGVLFLTQAFQPPGTGQQPFSDRKPAGAGLVLLPERQRRLHGRGPDGATALVRQLHPPRLRRQLDGTFAWAFADAKAPAPDLSKLDVYWTQEDATTGAQIAPLTQLWEIIVPGTQTSVTIPAAQLSAMLQQLPASELEQLHHRRLVSGDRHRPAVRLRLLELPGAVGAHLDRLRDLLLGHRAVRPPAQLRAAVGLAGALLLSSACKNTTLTVACSSDSECGANFRCSTSGQFVGACVCANDLACPSSDAGLMFCNPQGLCQSQVGCFSNADCAASGLYCDTQVGLCVTGPACGSDVDCPIGQVCSSQLCVAGCRSNGDCPLADGGAVVPCVCAGNLECQCPPVSDGGFVDPASYDRSSCPIGACNPATCAGDTSVCPYSDSCVRAGDGGLSTCQPDSRNTVLCQNCVYNPGSLASGCGGVPGANFCLLDFSGPTGGSNFCGVDCSGGQGCPSGYECDDVIILTSSPCTSDFSCKPTGGSCAATGPTPAAAAPRTRSASPPAARPRASAAASASRPRAARKASAPASRTPTARKTPATRRRAPARSRRSPAIPATRPPATRW